MAVQGDTCLFSALQTSSLNSCYVWIKRTGSGSLAAPTRSVTLNCVPCQLQTHRAAEEVTGLTPAFLSLSLAFPSLPSFACFTGHSISMPPTRCITVKEKTEWCTEDTSQSDGGTFFERSDKTWGLSCQITLTPCVKIPAMSPWSREADVLSLPSSSGQSCQDLLVKDTEDGADGKNELSEGLACFSVRNEFYDGNTVSYVRNMVVDSLLQDVFIWTNPKAEDSVLRVQDTSAKSACFE